MMESILPTPIGNSSVSTSFAVSSFPTSISGFSDRVTSRVPPTSFSEYGGSFVSQIPSSNNSGSTSVIASSATISSLGFNGNSTSSIPTTSSGFSDTVASPVPNNSSVSTSITASSASTKNSSFRRIASSLKPVSTTVSHGDSISTLLITPKEGIADSFVSSPTVTFSSASSFLPWPELSANSSDTKYGNSSADGFVTASTPIASSRIFSTFVVSILSSNSNSHGNASNTSKFSSQAVSASSQSSIIDSVASAGSKVSSFFGPLCFLC
ncbi:hypothetical protein SPOG_03604 [Schizosaccharomyces cryophilus OY26]|uniref:Uncharacterized protein n=1 Tax=Schizosaccharomyces cryophilus (strain OY26 / ATCC MYA-4695 / CBS 11777 / NBRC 106824 / NRRL Y48691) TaxID=653667 RepID=S9W554_SCHCR|nr:uncharacterized protein SPOG_03604 [Schizosaccharomyces cryophilus OY26]EPY53050.1 hypothetical protein SPOG_03604 [Schizosaccharomyces cryophilus OY26]